MKLIKSQVVFNPDEHTYMLGDKELSGITSVIGRQLFSNKYRRCSRRRVKESG